MAAKKAPPLNSAERLSAELAKTREELHTFRSGRDHFERMYRSEYEARIKLAGDVGALKERAANSESEAGAERARQEGLSRKLAFAEGYIAALQQKSYPLDPIEHRIDPDIWR